MHRSVSGRPDGGGLNFVGSVRMVVIMRSDEVRGILTDLVRRALTVS